MYNIQAKEKQNKRKQNKKYIGLVSWIQIWRLFSMHQAPGTKERVQTLFGGEKVCVHGLCMGFGVHTALINLHPVPGSAEDGFELCRMYGS